MSIDRWMDKEYVRYRYRYTHTHTHKMEYYWAIRKEWNNAIGSNVDGHRHYHTKWSKSDRERQISYITYTWNLKIDTNKLT